MALTGAPATAPSGEATPLAQRAKSVRQPLAQTLLAMTFTAGLVDASTYLGIGHVFAANMTGNVVFLGFGIAGSGGLPVLAPLISLAAFLLGAGLGGGPGGRLAERTTDRLVFALAAETALIVAAVAIAAATDVRPNDLSGDSVIALLAFAMGARNATVRRIAVPDLTTTVLTMTLTGLAADSRLFGGTGAGSVRRGSAVLAMFAGALAGALLLKTGLVLPLALAAAISIVLSLLYPAAIRGGRRHGQA
jgi:uncharacterized membrane protein YoaK (UPF0700 family)